MSIQLMDHCLQHNILPHFQTVYQTNYSTKISLLNITNDILWGMENQKITTMLILDLSAVFDTVVHDILLAIMERTFGFKEKAIKCQQVLEMKNRKKITLQQIHSRVHEYPDFKF